MKKTKGKLKHIQQIFFTFSLHSVTLQPIEFQKLDGSAELEWNSTLQSLRVVMSM